MSLANTIVKAVLPISGTTYAIPFDATPQQSSRIKVYLRDDTVPASPIITLQIEGAGDHYTINQAGTQVIFNSPPTGHFVIIVRELVLIQELDLTAAGALSPESLERTLDDAIKMVQQLNEKLNRVPALNVTSNLSPLILPPPVGNNIIGWNSAGTEIRNFTRTEFALVTGDLASTDALPEGAVNKYFTNVRADARADVRIAATVETNKMTTLGDLTRGGAAGIYTRLGIGAEGQRLGVSSGLPAWLSGNSATVLRSVTGTDTATTADSLLVLSSASFTETLPTAVGNSGKVFELLHNGTSLTEVYTIQASGAQLIGPTNTFLMHTNGQSLKIVSNNVNWLILQHDAVTDWSTPVASTIGAVTTPPTKGSVVTLDTISWRRRDRSAIIRFVYQHTAAGTAGTGNYLVSLITGLSADTTLVTLNTDTNVHGARSPGNLLGSGGYSSGTATGTSATPVLYSATQFRIVGSALVWGSASAPLSTAVANANVVFEVPIAGWRA